MRISTKHLLYLLEYESGHLMEQVSKPFDEIVFTSVADTCDELKPLMKEYIRRCDKGEL